MKYTLRDKKEMKDSGVEWVGKIPESWDTERLKNTVQLNHSALGPNTSPDYEVNYIDIGNVKSDGSFGKIERYSFEMAPSRARRTVRTGTVIFATVRPYLKAVAQIPDELSNVIISTGFATMDATKKMNSRYLYYTCASDGFVDEATSLAVGISYPAINSSVFGTISLPLPNTKDQKRIADFLDEKTAVIDEVVKKKKKQIELLKEKRAALITQAVTKGLDPNVKMKDSGVEWVDQLSSRHKVLPLKRLVAIKITDGPHTTPEILDEGIPFLSAQSVQANGILDFDQKRGFISKTDHRIFSKKCRPIKKDIFIVKSGATTGRVAMVKTEQEFSIWSPLALVRAKAEVVTPEYLYYFLRSNLFQKQIRLSWSYGTQENIGMGVIENLQISFPDIDEQESIIRLLEARVEKIDEAIMKIQKSIKLIQEYRSSLISHVVTGKIVV